MDRVLTPQQEQFLAYYTDPTSETFSNAYQSAKRAGYAEEYCQNITGQLPDWLSESISDLKRLRKAEKKLDQILDMDADGDSGKLKIQQDTAKFYAQGLGKSKYSTRAEHTGAGGKDLMPEPLSEEQKKKLDELL